MGTILKLYQGLLKKYPLVSQSIQTGVLMGSGDFIAQTLIEKKPLKDLNYLRTAQFIGVGTCFVGPTLTTWYRILSARVGNSGSTKVALKKVALDQLVFAPTFLAVFLPVLGLVQGHRWAQIESDFRANYLDIVISNYKLWPLVQIGNFYFTPLQYQVLVVQIVALTWNTYLSWKTQSSEYEN